MSRPRIVVLLSVLVSLFLLVSSPTRADPGPPKNDRETFYDLTETKVKLVLQRGELQRELKRLDELAPQVKSDEDLIALQKKKLDDIDKKIAELEASIQKNPKDADLVTKKAYQEKERFYLQDSIDEATKRMQGYTTTSIRDAQSQNRTSLENIEGEIEDLQRKILSISTPEQEFKKSLSFYFTVLIGMVIVGFFFVAFDLRVRRAIFAGQAGIQFVTLFSLVIAIILFGILGILEGKELAALLGGLSGYILGRVTTRDVSADRVPEERVPLAAPSDLKIAPAAAPGEIDAAITAVAATPETQSQPSKEETIALP